MHMKLTYVPALITIITLLGTCVSASAHSKARSDYNAGFAKGLEIATTSGGSYNLRGHCDNQSTQWCRGFVAGYNAAFSSTFPQALSPTTVINYGILKSLIIHSYRIPQHLYPPPGVFRSTSPTIHSFGPPSSLGR